MIDQNDTDCELNVSIGEMLFHFSSNYSAIFYIFFVLSQRPGDYKLLLCPSTQSSKRAARAAISIHYPVRY